MVVRQSYSKASPNGTRTHIAVHRVEGEVNVVSFLEVDTPPRPPVGVTAHDGVVDCTIREVGVKVEEVAQKRFLVARRSAREVLSWVH
jgi:hypothetical protein